MRKKKGPAFKMKSGNKTAFKMMGSSPVKVAGAFISEFGPDGELVERRVPYAEARAAEGTGKTVKYTDKEKKMREQEDRDAIAAGDTSIAIDEAGIRDAKRRDEEKARDKNYGYDEKARGYRKSKEIDRIAQKEIEGGTLEPHEQRLIDLARATGTDTTKSHKSAQTRVHLGDATPEQAYGLGVKKYKGARHRDYGDARYAQKGSAHQTPDQGRRLDDFKNLSNREYEEKYGYPKGK